ncbi:hypothetical protein R3P38DRAFT_2761424 [Favolaschia claudopus]|uniref:Uncharacterized protein n=1 Tax=Favolaschia claudopus TaxID=2862362 RepID=A0AAW0DQJ5_9AGAR
MARSNKRSSPPPRKPPARLLGKEMGKYAAQLPPNYTPPANGSTLVLAWLKDEERHVDLKLHRPPKDTWFCLADHKMALETIGLHPMMPIEHYDKRTRKWSLLEWDKQFQLPTKGTLLLRKKKVVTVMPATWKNYI